MFQDTVIIERAGRPSDVLKPMSYAQYQFICKLDRNCDLVENFHNEKSSWIMARLEMSDASEIIDALKNGQKVSIQ